MKKFLNFLKNLPNILTIRKFVNNRSEFYDDLLSAFKANISFDSFLKQTQEYANRLKLPTAGAYSIIRKNYSKQQSLSGALGPLVPITDKMVLEAAERSGNLEDGLTFLIKSIAIVKEMKAAISGAIILPLFLFAALAAMITGISLYGVPIMAELLPPEKWNASGQTLLAMASFVTDWGAIVLAVLVGIAYAFAWSLSNWTGLLRNQIDQKFPYSFYSSYQGAMLLISMTALNKGGVSIVSSLNQLVANAGPWLRWHLKKIQKNISQHPDSFAENFNTGMYPPRIVFRMALSAAAGAIESKLGFIAEAAIAETLKNIKATSANVNKVLLGIFVITLAWVFTTFLMTAQGVSSAVQ